MSRADEQRVDIDVAASVESFEHMVERMTPMLRRFAMLLSGNWYDAEDVVQIAFLRAYRCIDRIRAAGSPDAYMKQIVYHAYIDFRRKRGTAELISERVPDSPFVDHVDDRKWAIRSALAKVPPSQREVLILRFYADLSVEDTARALGCSCGNVKSQTSRGLAALHRHLEIAPDAAGVAERGVSAGRARLQLLPQP